MLYSNFKKNVAFLEKKNYKNKSCKLNVTIHPPPQKKRCSSGNYCLRSQTGGKHQDLVGMLKLSLQSQDLQRKMLKGKVFPAPI